MKKEEKEREELGWGLHFWKGAMKKKKERKVFVHWEVPSLAGMAGKAGCGGHFGASEKSTATSAQRAKWRKPCPEGSGLPALSWLKCLSTCSRRWMVSEHWYLGFRSQTPGKGLVVGCMKTT